VSACARRADRLAELERDARARGHGDRLHVAQADVTRPEETDAWIEAALARFGRVDGLVNNAGYGVAGPVEAIPLAEYRAQFETNFFAVVRLTQKVVPLLARAKDGDVIMISSVIGLMAMPGSSPYCSSKFALEGFAESIRPELRRHGIRVSVVNPGYTE